MKKLLVTLLTSAMAISFIGCGSSTQTEPTQPDVTVQEEQIVEEEPLKQEADIDISDFKLDYTLKQPDSIGNVYAEGTVTNNSSYPIENITFIFHYTNKEGSKDTTYLSFYQTILAGETSGITEGFGSDDMELIGIDVTLVGKDNKSHNYQYDAKLNKLEKFY